MNLPNYLTFARMLMVPILVVVLMTRVTHHEIIGVIVFWVASLTDLLDGYLARRLNVHSAFGAFLDPVADKLMVAAALVMLCGKPPVLGPCATHSWLIPVPAVAIIGREVAMSALREWAARSGPAAVAAAAVSWAGKVKTAVQMVAIFLLLAARDGAPWAGVAGEVASFAGPALLYAAAALALSSLASYWKAVSKHL